MSARDGMVGMEVEGLDSSETTDSSGSSDFIGDVDDRHELELEEQYVSWIRRVSSYSRSIVQPIVHLSTRAEASSDLHATSAHAGLKMTVPWQRTTRSVWRIASESSGRSPDSALPAWKWVLILFTSCAEMTATLATREIWSRSLTRGEQ